MRPHSTPTWLRGRRGIGPPRDRQVLVEGGTVAGVVVATVLHRAGYDPVVVGADRTPPSRLSVVWPPAFGYLDALGVSAAVRAAGVPVERASVWWTDEDGWTDRRLPDRDDPPPVVCHTANLRATLDGGVPPDVDHDRRIETLDPGPEAVTVVFEDGVREPFDLVVRTATPTTRGVTRLRGVEVATTRPSGVVDAWGHGAVAQALPAPGERGGVLRITSADGDPGARLDSSDWPSSIPFDGASTASVAVEQIERPAAAAWGAGRVARCGPAATPVASATGLRTGLDLEDALTLGVELVGDVSVTDAVDAYARRRRRRIEALFARADDALGRGVYPSPDGPAPLSTVAGLRAVGVDAAPTDAS